MRRIAAGAVMVAAGLFPAARAPGSDGDGSGRLARHFGWEEPRIIVVDRNVGPAVVADFNGDGLLDLACVNNSKSRIEVHLQRRSARTPEEVSRAMRVNQLPPNPWYDRVDISVAHRVGAFRVHDIDGDGRPDIVYAGVPEELVVLRQTEGMKFEVHARRRVRDLSPSPDGLAVADVMGEAGPELLAITGGRISVFGLSAAGVVGEPVLLGSGGPGQEVVAFFVEDYNGDGLLDVMAAVPESPTPIRVWLQGIGPGGERVLGPEHRFEVPPIRELEAVRFPGRAAASIAHIERMSRRIVISDLVLDPGSGWSGGAPPGATGGERDAPAEVFIFPGPSNKQRSIVTADIDGDGAPDLIATDQQANALVMYRGLPGGGFAGEERFSALKDPRAVAAGRWGDGPAPGVFVLSEADKVVGVSVYDASARRLGFPQPVRLATAGASPVAMGHATGKDGPLLAVVARDRRDHTLEVHRPGEGAPVTLALEGVNRPPQSMLSADFDHDGGADLILFTPGEPLVMVLGVEGPASGMRVLTDKSMPQFGLVQAAGPENTAIFDIDGDGAAELLIADQNFVRACSFSSEKGWRVVEQVTLPDAGASLSCLTVLEGAGGPVIAAYDKTNRRIVMMGRTEKGWGVIDRMRFAAFEVTQLHGAARTGAAPSLIAASDTAFAVVSPGGARYTLDEVAAHRSDSETLLEHELEFGDLNSDGFLDMVVLDAREQMCQVFTFTASRRLLHATEFKVFESRLFSRGDARQFEPSAAIIADLTGDGLDDLILQVHDRYMIYPQMGPARTGE